MRSLFFKLLILEVIPPPMMILNIKSVPMSLHSKLDLIWMTSPPLPPHHPSLSQLMLVSFRTFRQAAHQLGNFSLISGIFQGDASL